MSSRPTTDRWAAEGSQGYEGRDQRRTAEELRRCASALPRPAMTHLPSDGSNAPSTSAHSGCERFRGSDPLVTGTSRRDLVVAFDRPAAVKPGNPLSGRGTASDSAAHATEALQDTQDRTVNDGVAILVHTLTVPFPSVPGESRTMSGGSDPASTTAKSPVWIAKAKPSACSGRR